MLQRLGRTDRGQAFDDLFAATGHADHRAGGAAPPPSEAPAGPQPARWWNRVGTTIFDGFLVGLPIVIIAVAIAVSDDGTRTVQLVTSVAGVIYAAAMLASHRGQTVGKQVASVRVLREDGGEVGLGRAFGRELLKAIFGVTVVLYIVDALIPLAHRENRALHDLVAGTRVVMTPDEDAAG